MIVVTDDGVDAQVPLGDGTDYGAVQALSRIDTDTGKALPDRAPDGKFAPKEAAPVDEKVVDLKTGKPPVADAKPGHNGGPELDESDWLEIPATEDGKEPTRIKVDDVYAGYTRAKELETELAKAKEAAPPPDYWLQETARVIEARQKYIDNLEFLSTAMVVQPPSRALLDPSSPSYDPAAYAQQLSAHEDSVDRVGAVKAEREKQARIQQEQAGIVARARVAEETKAVRGFWPELFTAEGEAAARRDLVKAYGHLGLTDKVINSVDQAWVYALAKDALAARAAQAKAAGAVKAVSAKPRIITGAARSSVSAKQAQGEQAMARLAQSGSTDDAVRALAGIL